MAELIKTLSARERIYRTGGQDKDSEDSALSNMQIGSPNFCINMINKIRDVHQRPYQGGICRASFEKVFPVPLEEMW